MKTRCSFITLFFLLLMFCFVATSIAQPANTPPTQASGAKTTVIKKLSPKEAYDLVQSKKNTPNFVILDVRTPEEFESGHVEGAININYHSENFVEELNKLDKAKSYLVYCRTGRRSSDTVGIMTKQGFGELYRIDGDIIKWKSGNYPVVKGTK
jgi:rhodanese-related sulfurtransferase